MRKQAKLVAVLSAAALLAVGASMTAFAATPHWDMQDGEWVYLDRNGDKVTDTWKKSNGQWYYLDSDGFMAKDQVIEGDSDLYYVGQDGARVSNAWVSMDNDDLLDDDDEPESIDTVWMYFDASGKALGYGEANEEVKKLNYGDGQSAYFMFNNDGYMLSGWKERSGDIYYLGDQNEGWARTGWHELEINVDLSIFQGVDPDDDSETFWFYFKPNGKAYANTTQGYNGKTYAFDEVGRMLDLWTYKDTTGTYTNVASSAIAGAAYYAEENGGRDKNWIHAYPKTDYEEYDDDEYWFWLNSKGKPFKANDGSDQNAPTDLSATRVDDDTAHAPADADHSDYVAAKVIKNNTYLFNSNGVMLTGLFNIQQGTQKGNSAMDGGLYFFDKTGYPSSNEGKMVTNKKVKIDVKGEDKIYYFGKNGQAYTNAVISSLVYGWNGQLVEDYGDGSTYEKVELQDIVTRDSDGNYTLTDKNGKKVASSANGDDEVLINSYGRIKTSGKCKDINGDSVSVVNGIVQP